MCDCEGFWLFNDISCSQTLPKYNINIIYNIVFVICRKSDSKMIFVDHFYLYLFTWASVVQVVVVFNTWESCNSSGPCSGLRPGAPDSFQKWVGQNMCMCACVCVCVAVAVAVDIWETSMSNVWEWLKRLLCCNLCHLREYSDSRFKTEAFIPYPQQGAIGLLQTHVTNNRGSDEWCGGLCLHYRPQCSIQILFIFAQIPSSASAVPSPVPDPWPMKWVTGHVTGPSTPILVDGSVPWKTSHAHMYNNSKHMYNNL